MYDLILIIVAVIGGIAIGRTSVRVTPVSSGSSDLPSPQIVVNVPAEFKPLDTLPPTTIEGARAALWWTVFSCVTNGYSEPFSAHEINQATEAANAAVESVFGPTP